MCVPKRENNALGYARECVCVPKRENNALGYARECVCTYPKEKITHLDTRVSVCVMYVCMYVYCVGRFVSCLASNTGAWVEQLLCQGPFVLLLSV